MRRLSFLVLLLTATAAAQPVLERVAERRVVMGVECSLTLFAISESEGRAAARAAFERAEVIERAVSSWRPKSEVNELARKGSAPTAMSSVLCGMLAVSLDWAKRTDGAFDPTLYHSIRLWAEARRKGTVPSAEAIAKAHAKSGWQGVTFDSKTCLATISTPGLRFDFGGIAKGFAGDEMLKVLAGLGIDRAMVEVGGDVVASGPPPGKEGWTVRIGSTADSIVLANGAVATSSDVVQAMEVDGVRYSHILDPRTGKALERSVQVTVIVRGGALPGADADALASAASVTAARGADPRCVIKRRPGASLVH